MLVEAVQLGLSRFNGRANTADLPCGQGLRPHQSCFPTGVREVLGSVGSVPVGSGAVDRFGSIYITL
eukprot:14080007-Alexandrium_andersonii.AAC.1